MRNFTQEESARIRREMRKRRAIIHVWPHAGGLLRARIRRRMKLRRLERMKLRRLEIMRRKLDVLPPVVDEAMPYNRCFPPESHHLRACLSEFLQVTGQGELSWIWNNE